MLHEVLVHNGVRSAREDPQQTDTQHDRQIEDEYGCELAQLDEHHHTEYQPVHERVKLLHVHCRPD